MLILAYISFQGDLFRTVSRSNQPVLCLSSVDASARAVFFPEALRVVSLTPWALKRASAAVIADVTEAGVDAPLSIFNLAAID